VTVPRELFISHSHSDHESLQRLSEVLTSHGVPHWFAERDIRGSQQWHDEIGSALLRCDWFAVLLSPAALESIWVKREVAYAARHVERFGETTIPLLLEPCDSERLSWWLGGIQHISLIPDFEAGVRDLLRIWGIGYRR
jgi:hypothetical protein